MLDVGKAEGRGGGQSGTPAAGGSRRLPRGSPEKGGGGGGGRAARLRVGGRRGPPTWLTADRSGGAPHSAPPGPGFGPPRRPRLLCERGARGDAAPGGSARLGGCGLPAGGRRGRLCAAPRPRRTQRRAQPRGDEKRRGERGRGDGGEQGKRNRGRGREERVSVRVCA